MTTDGSFAKKYDVVIIGGGLAGLISSITLSAAGYKVALIEKKKYPFTKVCGEYISNEVLAYLQSLGFNPFDFGASTINRLRLSAPSGKNYFIPLDLGGFGISRNTMDFQLSKIAIDSGVELLDNTKVIDVHFKGNIFETETNSKLYLRSKFVIGSYGKRDMLDKKLNRDFIEERTGFMAVKYHIKTDYPVDEIGLDNFENGYCGIAKIEEDKYNLCYLYKRSEKFKFSNVKELEEQILFKNSNLKNIFRNSTFTDDPVVINEINFEKKSQVENHILMVGDSAGLITPLCGNGMSMAIHGAKLLADLLISSGLLKKDSISIEDRTAFESNYQQHWRKVFRNRLFFGRMIQRLFVNPLLVETGIKTIHAIPPLEKWMMKNTHGKLLNS